MRSGAGSATADLLEREDEFERLTEQIEAALAGDGSVVALELADRCGALRTAVRAREELLATGARPRRAARSGADSLTPSERRVCRLATEGLSNREIAQALFVTVRTVEGHLTQAYMKLDIASREQLAAALQPQLDATVIAVG